MKTFILVFFAFIVLLSKNKSYSQSIYESNGLEITANYSYVDKVYPMHYGFVYLIINVTVRNISPGTLNVSPFQILLIDASETSYAQTYVEGMFSSGKLLPDRKLNGFLKFEVDKNANNLKLEFYPF